MNILVEKYNFKLESTRVYKLVRELTSFEFLILAVLNQNTSDVLADRAFTQLARLTGRPIRPDALLSLKYEDIVEAIKVSGMYRRKAETILALAQTIKSIGEQLLDTADIAELSSLLHKIRGLGNKTVDVFLLFKRDYPTFPIDTHIKRVCERLWGMSVKYEQIREIFVKELNRDVEMLKIAHLVLIHHGKVTCRAVSPKCQDCALRQHCVYASSKV